MDWLVGAFGMGVRRDVDRSANEREVSKCSGVVLVELSSCVWVGDLAIWKCAPSNIAELEPARPGRVVASTSAGYPGECRFVRGQRTEVALWRIGSDLMIVNQWVMMEGIVMEDAYVEAMPFYARYSRRRGAECVPPA
jgi:hypothetical protein